MLRAVRRNFGLKILALVLSIVAWSYFRFAGNSPIAARYVQQLNVPITAVNVPAGYSARFSHKSVQVTLALKPGQPAFKPEEFKAVLDLSNRRSGVYNVPVQLVAPNVAVQSLSPASLALSVERAHRKEAP